MKAKVVITGYLEMEEDELKPFKDMRIIEQVGVLFEKDENIGIDIRKMKTDGGE